MPSRDAEASMPLPEKATAVAASVWYCTNTTCHVALLSAVAQHIRASEIAALGERWDQVQ